MAELLEIVRVDLYEGQIVLVELSDGSTIEVTLTQMLSLHPKVLYGDEPEPD